MDKENNFTIQKSDIAFAASMISMGGFLASFTSGLIRNRFGTIKSIVIFSIPSIIGWLLLVFSQNSWMVSEVLKISIDFKLMVCIKIPGDFGKIFYWICNWRIQF